MWPTNVRNCTVAAITTCAPPVSDVYRSCGEPAARPVGCQGVHDFSCTCDTDGCNAGLLPEEAAPSSGAGALWWWLMAVPATAAVLLVVAVALRLRQRRHGRSLGAEPAWQPPPAPGVAAARPPDSQQHRLL